MDYNKEAEAVGTGVARNEAVNESDIDIAIIVKRDEQSDKKASVGRGNHLVKGTVNCYGRKCVDENIFMD